MLKEIIVCDCCGEELKKNSETYHIDFTSSTFLDAAGDTDYNFERLDLCLDCARDAVNSFRIIANKIHILERRKSNAE